LTKRNSRHLYYLDITVQAYVQICAVSWPISC